VAVKYKNEKLENFEYPPEKSVLNLAVVGGGRACKFFLELIKNESFEYVKINAVGVSDIDPGAEGLQLAKEMGIYTTDNYLDLFKIKDLDGIIELTGSREVLLELIRLRPKGVGVLEHNIGKLLRTLFTADQRLKSAEQQVLLEKMASEFLIQQSNEQIVILEPDFKIAEANEPYLKAVKKSKDEVIGAYCYEITHGLSVPCPSAQPGLGCPMLDTLRTGESSHVIHEHPTADNNASYCDLVTYPLKGENGEIVRVLEIWRDITEELSSSWERRERVLKADLKRHIQEDRMISLGKLVASSVHEINNPIQGLLTFSHLMRDILETNEPSIEDLDKFKKYLSLMSGELERCGNIVSGLLSFSRQTGAEYRNVELNEILQQVISLTHHKMELQDIELTTRLSPRPLVVHGDVNQLQQCFLNLIFNAIEAMPDGGRLSVISELESNGKNALVMIKDTGHGIAQEVLDHIFDPFFTTKQEGEGTGLGLSIVYGVVKTHKGDIKITSHVGEGSSFALSFSIR
jgi:signal transduction histidine kinase